MKVYEIISENTTLTELEIRGVPIIPTAWIKDIFNVIRRGGTAAMVARKQLVEKLTSKYSAELVMARKEGRPDPRVYDTLKQELDAAIDVVSKSIPPGPNRAAEVTKALEKAGLSGKGLKSMLDEVTEGAEKIYSKSAVAADIAGKGLTGAAREKAIKEAAKASKAARDAAAGLVAGLNPNVMFIIKSLGVTAVVYEYYNEVKYIEAEYAKYPNSGMYRPNVGANGKIYNETQEAAYTAFQSDADKLLTKLELSLIAVIAPVTLAKLIKSSLSMFLGFAAFVSSLAGFGGAAVSAAGLGAGLVSLLTRASIALAKKAGMSVAQLEATGLVGLGAALTWIHETEAGKQFVATGLIGAITHTLGSFSREYLTKFANFAKEYKGPGDEIVNVAGNVIGSTQAGGGGPKAPPPSQATIDANAELAANEKLPRYLQITTKGKTKYLNNVRITDTNGYLLTGLDQLIARTDTQAKSHGVPNPFDSIPKDPKVNYSINIAL